MPSLISHAIASLGIGPMFGQSALRTRTLMLGIGCAVLPDADVLGFHLGVRYGDFWGHRGFTHSLLFAAIQATLVVLIAFRRIASSERNLVWLYFFLATASHGLLDAMTNGGLGVAFFSPFDTTRYFFSWRPILVSPIGVTPFFSPRGLAILRSEIAWVWLPAALLASLAFLLRRVHTKQSEK
jgi:inner membrane protein